MVNRRLLVVFSIIVLSASSLFAQGGYQGTDFWVAFPQNARGETIIYLKFQIYITSPAATDGTITDKRTGKKTEFTLEGKKPYIYEADTTSQIIENGTSNFSFHIAAEDDVTVICFNSRKASTDSYVAIPTNLLGTTYAVIGYDRLPTKEITFTTQFDVIATENNTNVTLFYPPGKGHADVQPKTITLNKGEVYHQNSRDFNQHNYDLTGTIIKSSFPVAFLSGSSCAQVPKDNNFCDVLLEMLPLAELNGNEFIIPAFALRDRSSIRVVAMSDTKVTLNGSDVAILRAGEYYQNDSIQGTAILKTSEQVYVVQYGQSSTASDEQIADPFMVSISPTLSALRIVDFVVPTTYSVVAGGWQHWVTIVSKTTDITNITVDGKTVDPSSFKQIPKTAYSIAHIEVANGSHRISSTTGITVYSYGYGRGGDNYESYGHNCGMNLSVGGQ